MVERSITGEHLIGELDRLAAQRGVYPAVLRCDNGPELACSAMADWAACQVGLHFIPPGEPWRNGYVESLDSSEVIGICTCYRPPMAPEPQRTWRHHVLRRRTGRAAGVGCARRQCPLTVSSVSSRRGSGRWLRRGHAPHASRRCADGGSTADGKHSSRTACFAAHASSRSRCYSRGLGKAHETPCASSVFCLTTQARRGLAAAMRGHGMRQSRTWPLTGGARKAVCSPRTEWRYECRSRS